MLAARERMRARLARSGRRTNAELTVKEVRQFCRLDDAADALARDAMRARRLSARGVHRALRVARTLADLAARDDVSGDDLALALVLRGAT